MKIETGALIVGLLSLILALRYYRIKTKLKEIVLTIVAPLIIATAFYWLPSLNKLNDSEYKNSAPLFITVFTVCGIIGSIIGSTIGRIIKKRHDYRQQINQRDGE